MTGEVYMEPENSSAGVLLVIPKEFRGYKKHYTKPPVGMGYVAESLDRNNINHHVIDMGLDGDIGKLISHIQEHKPFMIGITMMTNGYKGVYDLVKKIRSVSDAKIAIGGSHAFAFNERIFDECPADYVVPKEGEGVIADLCKGRDQEKIKGLYYRDHGRIIFTGERELIDFASFPFPRYRNFDMEKYARFSRDIMLQSSRGCPYNCIFCSSTRVFGKKFRAKSPKDFADEVEYWHNKKYRNMFICDDNFALDRKRVFDICDEIEKRNIKTNFIASNGIRADIITKDLLQRMKDIGFGFIAISVEGGNNKVLESMNKGETIEVIEKAIKTACDVGIGVGLYFLIGSPGETWEDFEDSLEMAKKYPVKSVEFFSLMPLPETKLYDFVKENDCFTRQPKEYLNDATLQTNIPCFQTPEMSMTERMRAVEVARKLRNEIARKNRELIPYMYGKLKGMVIQ